MKKVFDVARVTDEQKTSFATFMLKGEASYWWKANKGRVSEGIVTWDRFKELFFENYFPESMNNKMEIKFLELKQGNMSVAEYAAKFNKLARFATHQVDTEARKARRFEQGLKLWVYSRVAVLQLDNFTSLLEKAIIAEGGSEALVKFKQDKKKGTDHSREGSSCGSNPLKRKWNSTPSAGVKMIEGGAKKASKCSVCGKNHIRECKKGKGVCYSCG